MYRKRSTFYFVENYSKTINLNLCKQRIVSVYFSRQTQFQMVINYFLSTRQKLFKLQKYLIQLIEWYMYYTRISETSSYIIRVSIPHNQEMRERRQNHAILAFSKALNENNKIASLFASLVVYRRFTYYQKNNVMRRKNGCYFSCSFASQCAFTF